MRGIIASLAASSIICGLAASALGQEPVEPPRDLRAFTFVGTMTVPASESPLYGIHHFYVNPVGQEAFGHRGPYPEGTIFVGKIYGITSDEAWLVEGGARAVSVMRKDREAKTTGGWTFAVFGPDLRQIEIDPVKACFECHTKAKNADYVFSRPLD